MGFGIERCLRPNPHRIGLFLLAGVLLTGCASPNAPIAAGPTTWIDSPLDGSTLPLGTVQIVLHAASQAGIQSVELTVDGRALSQVSPTSPQDHIVNVQTDWSPPASGDYQLKARAVDGSGATGEYAQALVHIGPAPTTPTGTPTAPTASATPSPTASLTPSPTPAGAAIAHLDLSTHQVYWGGSCQPDSVAVSVGVSDPGQVTSSVFFYRLEDARSHEMGDWSQGQAMNPQGGGQYLLSVRGSELANGSGIPVALVHYQIALQLADGGIVRSQVLSDLGLSVCGSGPGPTPTPILIFPGPMVTIQPTTPVIR